MAGCNVNIALDPFAFASLIVLLVYIFVDDERQKERSKRLLKIKLLIEEILGKNKET